MNMQLTVLKDVEDLGQEASRHCANVLNEAINNQGYARLVLSTGASQLVLLSNLVNEDVDWSKVEMFHLDEYVGLSDQHPASFRKYLQERFVDKLSLKAVHLVNGEGDILSHIQQLSEQIQQKPIDLALIGIGENAHIAFNDPPANFDTKEAYIVVELDKACKKQQVREGWFESIDEVPKQAITMTVQQMLKSKCIISFVPYEVKAKAIKSTLDNEITPQVPATILKQHPNWSLYLDEASAAKV